MWTVDSSWRDGGMMEGPWVKIDVRRVLAAERWLERRRRRERWRDSRTASEGETGSRMLEISFTVIPFGLGIG